jgi:7-keto-8-aminopelargonate synthetase-like enzyme
VKRSLKNFSPRRDRMDKSDIKNLTLEQKKALVKKMLLEKKQAAMKKNDTSVKVGENYGEMTYDMFAQGMDSNHTEVTEFSKWVDLATRDGVYAFESERLHEQREEIELKRETGEILKLINFSSYNYLGYGYHPEVKQAAKDAIDKFGTGPASAPVISGTFTPHKELEKNLVKFLGHGDDYGVSLFSSGYGVNTGTISAYMKPGTYVILDETSHASLMEGAGLSGASMRLFKHNDMEDLEKILKSIEKEETRKLICCEGIYSADGDRGKIGEIVKLAKKYGAKTLIDEAHSIMVAGDNGRGVCEEQDVLKDVDMFVITFSKAFCSVGGALIAKKEITQYVNWYARCRMFSAALPPVIIGGILKALELGGGKDGDERRRKIKENSAYFKKLLSEKVDVLHTDSWIIPVIYGDERITLQLSDYLQRNGVDGGLMSFPAVPKGEARIRLFVTSGHTREQLEKSTEIIFKAAEKFGFLKK